MANGARPDAPPSIAVSSARKGAFIVAAIVAIALTVNELAGFYPLTTLFLDTRGSTRFSKTEDTFRLLFVGDIMLADWAEKTLQTKGYDYAFGATRELLRSADLTIGNLEGPIAKESQRVTNKRWSYKVSPKAAFALSRAGFDLMTLANNHIRDCGDAGIKESVAYLGQAGITAFGAGLTGEEAHRPAIVEVKSVSIAFLGYILPHMLVKGRKTSTRKLSWALGRGGAARGDIETIERDIRLAKKRAKVVIVSLHLSDRYQSSPEPFERQACHQIIEAGADAVIGHGSHIWGPVERYRGKPILYSIGNFAFGSRNYRARYSLIALLDLNPAIRRLSRVSVLPIYTNNFRSWMPFQPKVVLSFPARRVLAAVAARSRDYDTALELEPDPWRAIIRL
jgi:poly-gamma-glutamate capsule biosynthesis protein CapA/YwtB (metallophosphatase superfamily)